MHTPVENGIEKREILSYDFSSTMYPILANKEMVTFANSLLLCFEHFYLLFFSGKDHRVSLDSCVLQCFLFIEGLPVCNLNHQKSK